MTLGPRRRSARAWPEELAQTARGGGGGTLAGVADTEPRKAGTGADRVDEALDLTLQGVLELEVMMLRHLADAIVEEFAEDGIETVRIALHKYGRWRGQRMRQHHLAGGLSLSLRSMFEHWVTGDIPLLLVTGQGEIRADENTATLTIRDSPESRYLMGAGRQDLARDYYAHTYGGIAEGYDSDLRVDVPSVLSIRPGTMVTWWVEGHPPNDLAALAPIKSLPVLQDPMATGALVRRTVQNRGALYVMVAREAIHRFDVAGEHAVREGIRRDGRERGDRQRERHVEAGRPLTLLNLMSDFDVPTQHAWEWRDEYLSDGVWFQDCTFCPHIPVWKELDALDLGYIYDVEIHQSQFRAYNPEIRVQWETLQTRGSKECRFRFTIPSLQQPDEPQFVGPIDRL